MIPARPVTGKWRGWFASPAVLAALALTAAALGASAPARAQEAPVLTAQDDDFLPAFQPPVTGNPLAKIEAELDAPQQAAFAALIAGLPDANRAALLDLFEQFKLGHSGPNAEALLAFDAPTQQRLYAFLIGIGDGRKKMAYWLQIKGAGSIKGLITRLQAFSTEHALAIFNTGNPDALNDQDRAFWSYLNSAAKPVHAWGRAKADTAPWQIQLSRAGASANAFGPRDAALELKKYGRTLSRSQHNHVCGGVQIDAQWVLTAAHCIGWQPMANFTDNRVIRTGTLQLGAGGEVRRIVGGVVHPGFDEVTLRDDIALFRLADDDGPATPGGTGIKLPSASYPRLTNQPLELTGFGKTGETDDFKDALSRDGAPNTFSNTLLIARLRHVPSAQCTAYGAALFEKVGKRLPGQLCADSPDQADACQGDSGGPLFWRDPKGSVWLIGLVSFGKGRTCARSGLPGVYTDVQYYVRTGWIERAKKAIKPGAVIKGG